MYVTIYHGNEYTETLTPTITTTPSIESFNTGMKYIIFSSRRLR